MIPRGWAAIFGGLAAASLLAGGCDAILGVHELSYDGTVQDGGGSDVLPSQTDGARDAVGDAIETSDGPDPRVDASCPGKGGPASVRVGTFCVDSTEVTNAQYQSFLDDCGRGPGVASASCAQPAYCSFNSTFTPTSGWPYPPGYDTYPVSSVDWCDAHTFCAWAGKRLCGAIGGAQVAFGSDRADRAVDQWYMACSKDGARAYPYGSVFDRTACNQVELHGGYPPVRVASLPACVGGFPGLFDMGGNVSEWEDSCNAATGALDKCGTRGGSFNYGDRSDDAGVAAFSRCSDLGDLFRKDTFNDVGIRCCSAP